MIYYHVLHLVSHFWSVVTLTNSTNPDFQADEFLLSEPFLSSPGIVTGPNTALIVEKQAGTTNDGWGSATLTYSSSNTGDTAEEASLVQQSSNEYLYGSKKPPLKLRLKRGGGSTSCSP